VARLALRGDHRRAACYAWARGATSSSRSAAGKAEIEGTLAEAGEPACLLKGEQAMTSHRLPLTATAAILGLAILLPASAAAQGPIEPARWLVPRVEHHDVTGAYYGNNYCETTILVTNLAAKSVTARVDFEVESGPASDQSIHDEIPADSSLAFATAPMTPIQNAYFPAWGVVGSVIGHARVHAPRDVSVSAFLVCRDAPNSSPGKVLAMTPLPVIALR
jgi:hypothetical protein